MAMDARREIEIEIAPRGLFKLRIAGFDDVPVGVLGELVVYLTLPELIELHKASTAELMQRLIESHECRS